MKINIRQLSFEQLNEKLSNHPKFRTKQIHEWLWKKGAISFDQMTNLSHDFRAELEELFTINAAQSKLLQRSKDGTIKNQIILSDENLVESVLIPTEKRITACVSTQVGCSLDCKFCATSSMKRMRNLYTEEIVDQIHLINQQGLKYFGRKLSNIVFMGMGEPLLNYQNVVSSIKLISSIEGLGISQKKITISTSGIPKMIEKLGEENLKTKLALSLHSAIEDKRNKIMPFSKKFPLSDLLNSLNHYYHNTKRIITLEYIVWDGINDKNEDISALVRFCKKVPCKVNLIEYNPTDGNEFRKPKEEIIQNYIHQLEKNNIIVKIRRSRGNDIDAACGQLANKSQSNTLTS